MTRITFHLSQNGQIAAVDLSGHAGYAEEGEDIVCAAISVLVINTCNAIEQLTDAAISLITDDEEGLITCRLRDNLSEQTELLFSAMILGLESMAENEDYEEYIQLSYEEV